VSHASEQISDQQLILQYVEKGDKNALGKLFERYYHLVYGVGMKYMKQSDLAKDVTMQVFEKLIKDLKKHDIQHFKSWLYRVAQNACLMELRKNKSITKPIEENLLGNMESEAELHQVIEKEKMLVNMEQELEKLPADQQQCIKLFYLEKRTYNDICETTGFTFKQVKSFIQNGKRNLKIKLSATG
jgi:RNA polymerase sigma-70 factor (ECF subfamily)